MLCTGCLSGPELVFLVAPEQRLLFVSNMLFKQFQIQAHLRLRRKTPQRAPEPGIGHFLCRAKTELQIRAAAAAMAAAGIKMPCGKSAEAAGPEQLLLEYKQLLLRQQVALSLHKMGHIMCTNLITMAQSRSNGE
jgi:hypothetical protein